MGMISLTLSELHLRFEPATTIKSLPPTWLIHKPVSMQHQLLPLILVHDWLPPRGTFGTGA